ncbi:tRNA lysidine(34) synthetase TilS [Aestuariibius sp. 2305UL40-4]|uniref:tRNA lysidine(34) synthetase TilS n=1 Tax=Aestuariibius violaceus TaxID=3234132 RepID=UPI00345EF8C4
MEDLTAGAPPARLGLAVSGGSDSMALLQLACAWAAPRDVSLSVATVDHGLRAGAKDEAALVGEICAGLGLQHSVLEWRWEGQGNLQDAARDGRRQRLADWARAGGIGAVLLGHTADDQAETVLMRLARGSGVDGLCGMEAVTETEGVRWWRPLLDQRRAALRAWLSAGGHRWAEDPSNADPRFDRVRAREMLEALGDLGLTVDRLTRTAEHMRAARLTLEKAAAEFVAKHVTEEDGDLMIGRAGLEQREGDTLWRVLAEAVRWIGGGHYRPRFDALRFFLDRAMEGRPATLGGCLAVPASDGALRFMREAGAVGAPVPYRAGMVWDGRWVIEGPEEEGLTVGALGDADLAQVDWRATGRPRAALAASPALRANGQIVAVPSVDAGEWTARIVAPFATRFVSR